MGGAIYPPSRDRRAYVAAGAHSLDPTLTLAAVRCSRWPFADRLLPGARAYVAGDAAAVSP